MSTTTKKTKGDGIRDNAVLSALHFKKTAELSHGAFARWEDIPAEACSRYHKPTRKAELALGYIQAILAILHGVVQHFSSNATGLSGWVSMRSTTGSHIYRFSWHETATQVRIGGFVHDGKPTYQAAVVAFVQLYQRRDSAQASEVIERWNTLVARLNSIYPRPAKTQGWDQATLVLACYNPDVRPLIIAVADTLYFAMRYELPALKRERSFVVEQGDVLAATAGRDSTAPGSILLEPFELPTSTPELIEESDSTDADEVRPVPPTTPEPTVTAEPTLAAVVVPSMSATTSEANTPVIIAPATVPVAAPAAPPVVDTRPTIYGPHLARVKRALQRPGPLFLLGATAVGKTTLALRAAEELGMTVGELVVFDEGLDASELFGTYRRQVATSPLLETAPIKSANDVGVAHDAEPSEVMPRLPTWAQTLYERVVRSVQATTNEMDELRARIGQHTGSGNDWEPVDGPITRWARRVQRGEHCLLILDELPRGHQSVVGAIMRVMNTHDRRTVEEQGLVIPSGAEACDAFHIIEANHTRERLVVPAVWTKVIGTGNIGDKYMGLDLSDPAFRRRWSGGWLYLAAYDVSVMSEVLADRLNAKVSGKLITAIKQVVIAVEAYQKAEEKLQATLDLATLIAWGEALRATVAVGTSPRSAFVETAQDIWIDRICPLDGTQLDAEVRAKLLNVVTAAAGGVDRLS